MEKGSKAPAARYRVCPRCGRAVPLHSGERYCTNDGERMLETCPRCGAGITTPYARFCGRCGRGLLRQDGGSSETRGGRLERHPEGRHGA